MITPEAVLILCRFLAYGAAILLWGTSAYLCTLVPDRLAEQLDRRLRMAQVIAIAVMIAMTAVLLPLRAATIGDGWGDALNTATIDAVLFETNVGAAWMAQASAVILLLAAAFAPRRWRQRSIAMASGLVLATQPMIGHAAMNSGWIGIAHQANDVVHLLSGGAWLGSLLPVLMLLPLLASHDLGSQARIALMRFSTAGHVAVALVIATGIVNMLLIIGGPPLDWSFPYQALLFIKIALVALMALLAIANRYIFVPNLGRSHDAAMRTLVAATLAEILLGIAVVGLVGWFGTLTPT